MEMMTASLNGLRMEVYPLATVPYSSPLQISPLYVVEAVITGVASVIWP